MHPSKDMLTSWIQTISVMRNICAHNSRIYNRSLSIRPQLISSDAIYPQPRYNGLYQIMLTMKYLRPTNSSWFTFVNEFDELIPMLDSIPAHVKFIQTDDVFWKVIRHIRKDDKLALDHVFRSQQIRDLNIQLFSVSRKQSRFPSLPLYPL